MSNPLDSPDEQFLIQLDDEPKRYHFDNKKIPRIIS